jgi:hypothetical protein
MGAICATSYAGSARTEEVFSWPTGLSCWRRRGEERIPKIVSRHWNWIWFLGAAVWFLDAAIGMHHGALRVGLADAGISALFLVIGLLFRRQAKRRAGRGGQR